MKPDRVSATVRAESPGIDIAASSIRVDSSVAGSSVAAGSSKVRAEYQALVDCFPDLLRDLGTTIAPDQLRDLAVLMASIEHFDRVLDAVARPADREKLSRAAIAVLRGVDGSGGGDGSLARGVDGLLVAPVIDSLRALHDVAIRRGVRAEIADVTAETLANTERMRVAVDRADYLACVEREGELCVELALLIAQLSHAPTIAFLRAIAAPANLVDKLLDLRGDHRRGEAAVDPGLQTHLALAARIARGAWHASRQHPDRLRFAAWGARWFARMCRPGLESCPHT